MLIDLPGAGRVAPPLTMLLKTMQLSRMLKYQEVLPGNNDVAGINNKIDGGKVSTLLIGNCTLLVTKVAI